MPNTINPTVRALEALLESFDIGRIDSADIISLPLNEELTMVSSTIVAASPATRVVAIGNLGNQFAFLSLEHDAIGRKGLVLPPGSIPAFIPLPPNVELNGIAPTGNVDVCFQHYGSLAE